MGLKERETERETEREVRCGEDQCGGMKKKKEKKK